MSSVSDSAESGQSAAGAGSSQGPSSSRSLLPTPRVWCWAAILLTLIVVIRASWLFIPWPSRLSIMSDTAIMNLLTLILGFALVNLFAIWFFFRSGYSTRLRWMTAAGLAIVLLVAAASLRIEGVSGAMLPTVRWVGSVRQDRLLPTPVIESAAQVDLTKVSAQDFPDFLGPRRLARVDVLELEPNWQAQPPREKWRRAIGAGWSGFAAVNGYAVTLEQRGDEEWVTCYTVATGEPVWAHAIPGRHETLLGGAGPRSTPVIFDGKVYTLGALGMLLCLDGATGKPIWQQDLLTRIQVTPAQDMQAVAWGRANSPLVFDQSVVVPLGGKRAGPHVSLIAFDRLTGDPIWQAGDRQVSYASPTLAELCGKQQILSVNEDQISGHDPESGQILWTVDWPGNSASNASVSQPVPLPPDQFLLTKGYGLGAALYQLLPAASQQPWTVRPVWANERVLKTKFTNVVVHKQHVYGLSEGVLECVALSTGERAWKAGRYGHGQMLGVGDHLLVLGEEGELVLVAADPSQHRELGRVAALNGKAWNTLCLFGSQLLVRNASEAVCFELTTRVSKQVQEEKAE